MSLNLTQQEFARLSTLVALLPPASRGEFEAVLEGPKLRQLAESLLTTYGPLLQTAPKEFFHSWIVAGEYTAIAAQNHKFATHNPSFTLAQPPVVTRPEEPVVQTVSSILQEVLPPAAQPEPSNLPHNSAGWVRSPLSDGQFRKRDQQIFPLGNVKDDSLTDSQLQKAGITKEGINPPFQVVDGELVKPGFTDSGEPLGAPQTGFADGDNGTFGAVQTGFADGNGEAFGAPQTGFTDEYDDQAEADIEEYDEDEDFDVEDGDENDDNDVSLPGFTG